MIAAMKAQGREVATILFTAYDDAKVRREAKAVGVTRFIAKPFIVGEFINAVREQLPIDRGELGVPPPLA
jgi:FixJ family two-component response regulator